MAKEKSTDIQILEIRVGFEPVSFRTPLKFGGRIIDQTFLINVFASVETRKGNRAEGFGSMPVGNVWAWPSSDVSAADGEKAMKAYAEKFGELFASYPDFGHPIEIQFNVAAELDHQAKKVSDQLGLSEPLPALAQLVATSAIDAAIHDGYGRANKANCFNVLSSEFCNEDLSYYLDDSFKGEFLDRYTLREPVARLPLYHLVGALDPLTDADVSDRPGDSLPVTLGEWIAADGLTHLKIKLAGDNPDWDVQRVLNVERVAAQAQSARGCSAWYYSCDFNEKCDSAEYVIEFLNQIRSKSSAAYDRIQYIEQPTGRDLEAASAAKMHDVAKLKPVVIDEALVDYEALLKCRELGYSGVALKACKGQTESLFAAAAAQKYGMFLCVQDLTCPGASFLHSCSLASRIPGVAAVEGNARQYCPAPNIKWAKRYPEMFRITDGTVGTGRLTEVGLGFHLAERGIASPDDLVDPSIDDSKKSERIQKKAHQNDE
ncbi:MAG: hypothetical protein KDA89_15080 [Planctomycetaceae bacterium]|nr:hypothetical protein [Planctomycetaceae bacterium]